MMANKVSIDPNGNAQVEKPGNIGTANTADDNQSRHDMIQTRTGGIRHSVTINSQTGTTSAVTSHAQESMGGVDTEGRFRQGSDVSDDTLVSIQGVQLPAGKAREMGLMNDRGQQVASYQPADQKPRDIELASGEKASAETRNLPNTEAQQAFAELQQADNATAANAVTQMVENGKPSEATISQLASQLGKEPSEVSGELAKVQQSLASEAKNAVSGKVNGLNDLAQFARETGREADLQQAMLEQVNNRSTGGYEKLAEAYVEALPQRNPDAILNADFGEGVSARKDAQGRVLLDVKDVGEVEFVAAVKSGIVSLG
jgi:hypothetical protein